MFCPKCGEKHDDNVRFCGKCGAEITPVPAQVTSQTTKVIPPVQPLKPVKPPKSERKSAVAKPGKLVFTKDDGINLALWLGLAALYICTSLIFIMIFNMEETIAISSSYNSSYKSMLSLQNFLDILSMGNRMFNVTMLSNALSIGVEIFFYSVPVFAGMALISTIFSKKNIAFHIASSVVSIISAILLAVVVPVSMGLIPGFKTALATRISMIPDDINKVTYSSFIIHAVVAIVFAIGAIVISVILNKRRNKK